jgi:hypothetical protein
MQRTQAAISDLNYVLKVAAYRTVLQIERMAHQRDIARVAKAVEQLTPILRRTKS